MFQSPQWGSNSKVNGYTDKKGVYHHPFQSPQWGSNSKVEGVMLKASCCTVFQSPQWGSNSKGRRCWPRVHARMFQSPQWGSNSKGYPLESA